MERSPTRAVAFDVGNVLVDWRPETLVEPFAAATGLPGERAMAAAMPLFTREKQKLELGDLSPAAFAAELNRAVLSAGGRPLGFGELLRIWCSAVRPRPGAGALVRRLRPDLSFAVWSNTDPMHFTSYGPRLTFLSRARSIYLSFIAGVGKPDEAFFRGALAALDLPPGEVFFLDDTRANVEAARAIGIDAAQVATLADAEAALAERGLLGR